MVALIKGVAMVDPIPIPTIPMTARGLLLMRTLHGHRATQSTPDTITPPREMPMVLYLRTIWNLKKYESSLLTHMLRLMTRETRDIARVELQSLPDATPHTLLLTKPLQKSWKLLYHPIFPVMVMAMVMLLRPHQSHTLIRSLFLNNMSNITPHTRIHAIGSHLRSYMLPDLITIPIIIMPHRQSYMPQPRHQA